MIVIDLVVLTMSRNHAYKKLSKMKPPTSLVAMEMLVSLGGHIVLQVAFQVGILFMLHQQCWYTDLTPAQGMSCMLQFVYYTRGEVFPPVPAKIGSIKSAGKLLIIFQYFLSGYNLHGDRTFRSSPCRILSLTPSRRNSAYCWVEGPSSV